MKRERIFNVFFMVILHSILRLLFEFDLTMTPVETNRLYVLFAALEPYSPSLLSCSVRTRSRFLPCRLRLGPAQVPAVDSQFIAAITSAGGKCETWVAGPFGRPIKLKRWRPRIMYDPDTDARDEIASKRVKTSSVTSVLLRLIARPGAASSGAKTLKNYRGFPETDARHGTFGDHRQVPDFAVLLKRRNSAKCTPVSIANVFPWKKKTIRVFRLIDVRVKF